jgi:hypothetical protein
LGSTIRTAENDGRCGEHKRENTRRDTHVAPRQSKAGSTTAALALTAVKVLTSFGLLLLMP